MNIKILQTALMGLLVSAAVGAEPVKEPVPQPAPAPLVETEKSSSKPNQTGTTVEAEKKPVNYNQVFIKNPPAPLFTFRDF